MTFLQEREDRVGLRYVEVPAGFRVAVQHHSRRRQREFAHSAIIAIVQRIPDG